MPACAFERPGPAFLLLPLLEQCHESWMSHRLRYLSAFLYFVWFSTHEAISPFNKMVSFLYSLIICTRVSHNGRRSSTSFAVPKSSDYLFLIENITVNFSKSVTYCVLALLCSLNYCFHWTVPWRWVDGRLHRTRVSSRLVVLLLEGTTWAYRCEDK